jgi:hypothetical protein
MGASPFGEPGVSPAALRAFLARIVEHSLEFVPEERRDEAIEGMARIDDNLKATPAEAGDVILFGEAAEQLMREVLDQAIEELRRAGGT